MYYENNEAVLRLYKIIKNSSRVQAAREMFGLLDDELESLNAQLNVHVDKKDKIDSLKRLKEQYQ